MNSVPGIDKDSTICLGMRIPTIKKYYVTKEKMMESKLWMLSKETTAVLDNKEKETKIEIDNVLRLMFGSSVNTGIKVFDDHRKEIKDRIISGI